MEIKLMTMSNTQSEPIFQGKRQAGVEKKWSSMRETILSTIMQEKTKTEQ